MPENKCYKGQLMITKNTSQEEKEKEPKLEVCGDNEACSSLYYRTDVTLKSNETILAGSWFKKGCAKKSGVTQYFGEDLSDRCVEYREGIKSGKAVVCICSTTECNGGIHAFLSTLSIVFAMTVFILTQ